MGVTTCVEFVDAPSTLSLDKSPASRGSFVDVRRETPEPWATAMMEALATAPNGAPSITRLAEMAGISVETTRRVLYGMGDARVETINAIAAALRTDVRKVSEWAEQARSVAEPYKVPAEADLLTDKERRAVTNLIRAITDGRRRSNEASQEPGSQAGGAELEKPTPIAGRRRPRPALKPLPKAARTPRRGKKGEAYDPESGGYVGGETD